MHYGIQTKSPTFAWKSPGHKSPRLHILQMAHMVSYSNAIYKVQWHLKCQKSPPTTNASSQQQLKATSELYNENTSNIFWWFFFVQMSNDGRHHIYNSNNIKSLHYVIKHSMHPIHHSLYAAFTADGFLWNGYVIEFNQMNESETKCEAVVGWYGRAVFFSREQLK